MGVQERVIFFRRIYSGYLLKNLKFDSVMEEVAQLQLMKHIQEHDLDLADYEVIVTYELKGPGGWDGTQTQDQGE